jgi:uncharacterized protein Yka (UPF0111/DUF47 family)
MQNSAEQMRLFMALTEGPAEYTGPRDDPNVSYSAEQTKGEITKVIANLSSHESGKYTKLGRNLKRIERVSALIDKLKENVKQETREKIADLFHAEDACRTRVIETVSFTFKMTKDPVASNTTQYAKVLEELENHLTPELVVILEGLKNKYSKVVQKEPSLIKVQDKVQTTEESFDSMLDEGILDSLKAFFHKYLQKVLDWGRKYDTKLAKLEQLAASAGTNESLGEADVIEDNMDQLHQLVYDAINLGKAYANNIAPDMIAEWEHKVESRRNAIAKNLQ